MRCKLSVFGLCGVTSWIVFALVAPAVADAPDRFEGAIWRFEMTSRKHPDVMFKGFFRVSENVLYQAEKPSDRQMSKRVGTNHPNGKRTQFDVRDFRVFPGTKREPILMKGTARLSLVKFGEWEGMFTDGMGGNWDFHAYRIQE